jgi:outer membrane protein assembly factor BamE (lipoprotein component of BamABCDE complex)
MAVKLMNAMARAVCWTAGLFEGLVSGKAGQPPVGRGRLTTSDRLDELRAMLLGRDRRQVMRLLGVPPTACVGFGVSVVTNGKPVTFLHAPTWYYPFDTNRRQAIAIQFSADRARGIEFIGELE